MVYGIYSNKSKREYAEYWKQYEVGGGIMNKINLSIGERLNDGEECTRRAIENKLDNLRVSMPGEIVDFNAENQTATVKPLVKEYVRGKWVSLPMLLDVPCFFPRAGGYCLTFSVKTGDECLVIFGDMCIDAWWQSGGEQTQLETRRHDLSDAMCLLGITSVPRAVKGYSTNSMMLRNEDADVYFEITDDKTMNIHGIEDINIMSKEVINVTTVNGAVIFKQHGAGGKETVKFSTLGDNGVINIITTNTDEEIDTFDITLEGQKGIASFKTTNITEDKVVIYYRLNGQEGDISASITNYDTGIKTITWDVDGQNGTVNLTTYDKNTGDVTGEFNLPE